MEFAVSPTNILPSRGRKERQQRPERVPDDGDPAASEPLLTETAQTGQLSLDIEWPRNAQRTTKAGEVDKGQSMNAGEGVVRVAPVGAARREPMHKEDRLAVTDDASVQRTFDVATAFVAREERQPGGAHHHGTKQQASTAEGHRSVHSGRNDVRRPNDDVDSPVEPVDSVVRAHALSGTLGAMRTRSSSSVRSTSRSWSVSIRRFSVSFESDAFTRPSNRGGIAMISPL